MRCLVLLLALTSACASTVAPSDHVGPWYLEMQPGTPAQIEDSVMLAAARWNELAGHEVFMSGTGGLTVSALPEGCWEAGAIGLESKSHASVQLCAKWMARNDDECQLDAAMHELGHVLGLTHTDDPTNVMSTYSPTAGQCGRTVSLEQVAYLQGL